VTRLPDTEQQPTQIGRLGAGRTSCRQLDCRPGGSARDYLPGFAWLAARLWSNARAAVRMFMHRHPRGERPQLPRRGAPLRSKAGRRLAGWRGLAGPGTAVAPARDDHGGRDVSQRRLVAVWHCPTTLSDSPHCPPAATPRQNPTTLPARESASNVVDAATIIPSAGCTLTLNRLRNVHKPAAKDR
jgi:hypothetical protein